MQAGAERGGGELLAELLEAAQLGMHRHEREVRLRDSGHGDELQPFFAAELPQAGGELLDRGPPRFGGQALPAGAVDAEELVDHRPADDVLQALLRP